MSNLECKIRTKLTLAALLAVGAYLSLNSSRDLITPALAQNGKSTVPEMAEEQDQAPLPEKNTVQSGTMDIDVISKQKTGDPYLDSERSTLAYLKALDESLANPHTLEAPADGLIHYLTGAYLFCSIRKGTCPALLDALLEVDVVNSRLSKQPACPTMKRFWKHYLENDLERRHKYQIQTGHLTLVADFNAKTRPRYIKCDDTVRQIIAAPGSDADFFKSRYAADSSVRQALKESIGLVNQFLEKGVNVFLATGAQ